MDRGSWGVVRNIEAMYLIFPLLHMCCSPSLYFSMFVLPVYFVCVRFSGGFFGDIIFDKLVYLSKYKRANAHMDSKIQRAQHSSSTVLSP